MGQKYVIIEDDKVHVCLEENEQVFDLETIKSKSGKMINRLLEKMTSMQYNFTLDAGSVDHQYEIKNSKTVSEYIIKNLSKFAAVSK